jgi:hypothetical protein
MIMSCMEMGACMKWRRTVGAWIGWADLLLTAGNPSINHPRLFFLDGPGWFGTASGGWEAREADDDGALFCACDCA